MLPVALEESGSETEFPPGKAQQYIISNLASDINTVTPALKSSFWEKETSVALSLHKSLPASEGVPSSCGGGAESLDQASSETPAMALAIEGYDNGEIIMDVSEMLVHKHLESGRWKTCSVGGLSVRKGSHVPSE